MKTLSPVAFLSVAIVFNAAASLLFKLSSREDQRHAVRMLVTALLLGAINALCYTKALTKIDLSVAYPIFAAGSIVLACIASGWFFGETTSMRQSLGMAAIIGGMVLVCAK
jgi:multidrug transporter EmrE-like cation transporter